MSLVSSFTALSPCCTLLFPVASAPHYSLSSCCTPTPPVTSLHPNPRLSPCCILVCAFAAPHYTLSPCSNPLCPVPSLHPNPTCPLAAPQPQLSPRCTPPSPRCTPLCPLPSRHPNPQLSPPCKLNPLVLDPNLTCHPLSTCCTLPPPVHMLHPATPLPPTAPCPVPLLHPAVSCPPTMPSPHRQGVTGATPHSHIRCSMIRQR